MLNHRKKIRLLLELVWVLLPQEHLQKKIHRQLELGLQQLEWVLVLELHHRKKDLLLLVLVLLELMLMQLMLQTKIRLLLVLG